MVISNTRKIYVADYLGVVPYEIAFGLQHRLVQARSEGNIPDILLLLQHTPVFTIGRFRGEADIIAEAVTQRGINVFNTNRGGGITYHGPGQLVGYPIINLKELGIGVREYIWKLEEVIIKSLLSLGIYGHRLVEHPGGVWVGDKKVCSVGIHVSRHITMHGFALNICNDLRYFEYIRPCGLSSKVMTSLSELRGCPVEIEAIIENLLHAFSETFGLKCERGDGKWLTTPDALNG